MKDVNMDRSSDAPTVIVRASPEGYRWKVIARGQAIGTGTAKTELDARNAANEFCGRANEDPIEGP
jgi:hypothetical protein